MSNYAQELATSFAGRPADEPVTVADLARVLRALGQTFEGVTQLRKAEGAIVSYQDANPLLASSGTLLTIPFNNEKWDSHGLFDLAQPTVLRAHKTGIYALNGGCAFFSNASGHRQLMLLHNDLVGQWGRPTVPATPGETTHMEVSALLYAERNATFSLAAFQNSGVALGVNSSYPWFAAVFHGEP